MQQTGLYAAWDYTVGRMLVRTPIILAITLLLYGACRRGIRHVLAAL